MKKPCSIMIAAMVSLLLLSSLCLAQTTWIGGATDHIGHAANWDPANLPTNSGNLGTINSDSRWVNDGTGGSNILTDYYLNVTGGTVDGTLFGTREFNGGSQSFNGGSLDIDNQLTVDDSTFSIDGSASLVDLEGALQVRGTSTVTVNAGELNATVIEMFDTGSFVMNGGTVDFTGNFFSDNFAGGGSAQFNGGTLTTTGNLEFKHANTLTLGGSLIGSATFADFGDTSNVDIDWLPGSQMSLTIGSNNWAETEWNANRLTFDGQSSNDLAKAWNVVTNSNGLGNYYRFDYDTDTETLSLAHEPPPSGMVFIVE